MKLIGNFAAWLREITRPPLTPIFLEEPVIQDGETFQGWVLMEDHWRHRIYFHATERDIALAHLDWSIK